MDSRVQAWPPVPMYFNRTANNLFVGSSSFTRPHSSSSINTMAEI